jgi:hypothetical protein
MTVNELLNSAPLLLIIVAAFVFLLVLRAFWRSL